MKNQALRFESHNTPPRYKLRQSQSMAANVSADLNNPVVRTYKFPEYINFVLRKLSISLYEWCKDIVIAICKD